jgi:hypothetical protein
MADAGATDSGTMTWIIGAAGVAGGYFVNVLIAIFGRKNALEARIEGRIKILLEAYEKQRLDDQRQRESDQKTIRELRDEISKLEEKIDTLMREMRGGQSHEGFGAPRSA